MSWLRRKEEPVIDAEVIEIREELPRDTNAMLIALAVTANAEPLLTLQSRGWKCWVDMVASPGVGISVKSECHEMPRDAVAECLRRVHAVRNGGAK